MMIAGVLHSAERPRLVVVISYDQMRGDFPSRFARFVDTNGFERVRNHGVWFPNCRYDLATMITSPGHAALLTGCYPWKTGITGNDMLVRHTLTECSSTFDATYGASPDLLRVPTVGDALRAEDRRSKVISIALKNRAAVFMAGHDPTYALWFHDAALAFTSSAYYQRPPWLGIINSALRPETYQGLTWRAGIHDTLHPAYDDIQEEGALSSGHHVFPYRMPSADDRQNFADDFQSSPYSVTYLFDAATEIVRREQLGGDTIPDILAIGVSTTDFLGHQFGPDSREVQELYAACDTTLANFIDMLDARVGREHYVLAITSDHGVSPIPEWLARQGEPQGVNVDAGRLRSADVRRVIDSALTASFGAPNDSSWIRAMLLPSVFLDTVQLVQRSIDVSNASAIAAHALKSIHGLLYTTTRSDLMAGRCAQDIPRDICRYIMHSFDADRCGDVMTYPKQNWIFGRHPATHGTPHDYDRHVPLMIFGHGITGARNDTPVSPVDLAPTIALLLKLQLLDTDGTTLHLK